MMAGFTSYRILGTDVHVMLVAVGLCDEVSCVLQLPTSKSLSTAPQLQAAAKEHADDMIANNIFQHE